MSDLDAMKSGLAGFVRSLFPRLDYLALYPAKVVSQNGDGSLELAPDDQRLPGLSNVPIRLGLPGTTVQVSSGSRVLLGFENGDPGRPVATLWESSALTQVVITCSDIQLGSAATHGVPLGDALLTWLNAHVHTSAAPGSPTTIPVTPATSAINSVSVKVGA